MYLYASAFGAIGCLVRYLFERAAQGLFATERPWATMVANALGCAVAGWAAYKVLPPLSPTSYAIIVTGFCGGLTTFSSAFAVPGLMWQAGRRTHALIFMVSTPIVCTAAFLIGVAIAH